MSTRQWVLCKDSGNKVVLGSHQRMAGSPRCADSVLKPDRVAPDVTVKPTGGVGYDGYLRRVGSPFEVSSPSVVIAIATSENQRP